MQKNVIFAGHLTDNTPTAQKRQQGFLRTFSKPSEDQFKPLAKTGLRDCANKSSAPLVATNRGGTSEQTQSQTFFWASKNAYANLRQFNVFVDDQILTFGTCNPIVTDYDI